MPDKTEAFDDVFEKFQAELESPLTPEGTEEFIRIYRETIGHYLVCDKDNGDTRDFWTIKKFRDWALDSVEKVAKGIDYESKKKPAEAKHVRVGAHKVFVDITKDPKNHCNNNKEVPRCVGFPGEPLFGPVCDLYFRNHPTDELRMAEPQA